MIQILGMEGCGPCKEAKERMASTNMSFAYYNSKERGNPAIQELKKSFMEAGAKKVPAFFDDGKFVGEGLEALDSML